MDREQEPCIPSTSLLRAVTFSHEQQKVLYCLHNASTHYSPTSNAPYALPSPFISQLARIKPHYHYTFISVGATLCDPMQQISRAAA